ncbi:MAG: BofC C-terminal domain-containing protein [Halanaerobiales bacterium]|nr:BofC C-terminal domain-containing protein [Halanaerobiales bacterium]
MRRYSFLALILIAFSALITYSVLNWNLPMPKQSDNNLQSFPKSENFSNELKRTPFSSEEIEVNLPSEKRIAQLVLERYYTYCKHTTIEELRPDSPLRALSREELLKLYSGWIIKEDLGSKIVFFHTITDLCPDDLTKRYVGEKNGFVAIFYGQPGMKEKVYKMIDIPFSELPLQLQSQLEVGIQSESDDHLISIIEGLAVYYDE